MPWSQSMTSEYRSGTNCTITKRQFPGGHDSQTHLEEAEMLSWSALKNLFSASSNPLPTSGPGPTQIPKHSEEYKPARVSAFIIWLSCFDLRVLILPRLEKMSPILFTAGCQSTLRFPDKCPNCTHLNEQLDQDLSGGELNSLILVLGKPGEK